MVLLSGRPQEGGFLGGSVADSPHEVLVLPLIDFPVTRVPDSSRVGEREDSGCHDSAPHEQGVELMRRIYTGLAWTIAGAVVVQAAAIAFAFGGVLNRVANGDVVDKALLESRSAGGVGESGFIIHGIVGGAVIPLLAIAMLIVSFFVHVRGARLWAVVTLGLVVLQVTLGISITGVPYLGLLHGANALAIVAVATVAALRVRGPADAPADSAAHEDAEGATSDAVAT
jgi:heme A synthase